MSSYVPISLTTPQYIDGNGDPYSGAVLKAYQAGTSTLLQMATDPTGSTLINDSPLDSNGYPTSNGSTIIIPHVNSNFKLSLYPTQAAADSNTGAIWTIDNINPGIAAPETQNSNYTLTLSDNNKIIIKTSAATTATTITIPLNSSESFPVGALIAFYNFDSEDITITADSTATLKLIDGTPPTDGDVTLSEGGIATLLQVDIDDWVISGNVALS